MRPGLVTRMSAILIAMALSGSPRIAKLQVKTPVVPGALCVLEIHQHALHGLDHEVQTRSNRRIYIAVQRDRCLAVQRSGAEK